MALKIENEKIVGTIDNLQDKLEGKLPVDRLELLVLVNSWGRINFFYTEYLYEDVKIEKCEATQSEQALLVRKECYDLSKLDVSQITNMDSVFCFSNFNDIHSTNGIGLHNGDISKWDTSNVTSMERMFDSAIEFNQPLNGWNTSNVTNMSKMFRCAKNFNGDISKWDVSNVNNLNGMFQSASNFNQDLSNWNISNVTNMNEIFFCAPNFNQPLNNWDVSNVTSMVGMFYGAEKFNQNISSWIFNDNTNISGIFEYAIAFKKKYNKGESFSLDTEDIKEWFNFNRERMNDIDIKEKHGEEINNFFNKLQTNSIQEKDI